MVSYTAWRYGVSYPLCYFERWYKPVYPLCLMEMVKRSREISFSKVQDCIVAGDFSTQSINRVQRLLLPISTGSSARNDTTAGTIVSIAEDSGNQSIIRVGNWSRIVSYPA